MSSKQKKAPKMMNTVVISDMHLGTRSCKAKELLGYLKSVQPQTLVLNGDVIDIWQFSKSYFPKSHLKVIRQIIKMMEQGTTVYYIVGNHDEALRRFVGLSIGNLFVVNKVLLNMDGKKSWIFHGDAFDVVMHHSKWLAKLGATGYAILTIINKTVNDLLALFGQRRISLSRDIKRMVKTSRKTDVTTRFEKTVSDLAIKKRYHYAICGHIHWPAQKLISNAQGSVMYLNSGDWVENLTALEYADNQWDLVYYKHEDPVEDEDEEAKVNYLFGSDKVLFKSMFRDVLSD
ncbi:UDP-2,3-diacylglucosamine diphosphatase [Saccharicrinis fermentans]|uniref:UDP-2,3-diacylglucosamine hydrolase n=1 Tax=Saccharicrinis fermentans DSM 9555 = JCM 21142 TaxID=869213 RepID=W7YGA0_9BACT|nr:UDP-2,3-diacylglucosamine diphosphatase [Saccharicrinis fermentans]GAF01614.1 UDP-2,3-diacylglucosamine hydrolase [Saccharicrinis fermentans DSM 9555 = JCM 21142]